MDFSQLFQASQDKFNRLANLPLDKLPGPKPLDIMSVANLPNGYILKSDGSTEISPTANKFAELQQSLIGQIANPNILQQLQQASKTAPFLMSQQPQQEILNSGAYGQNFAVQNTAPQQVLQNLNKNANVTDNPLFQIFKNQLPRDPIVTFYQRLLQNNPDLAKIFEQNPFAMGEMQTNEQNPFARFDRQTVNPLVRHVLSQYGNFNVQAPSQGIPSTQAYMGANTFNARII